MNEKIKELDREIEKIESLTVLEDQKNAVIEYMLSVKNTGIATIKKREEALSLSLSVMPDAIKQFDDVLLNKIFKPNAATFHYDAILDGLNFLAGKFIPG